VAGSIHDFRGFVTQKSKGCFYDSLHSSDSPLCNNKYSFSLRLGLINISVYKVYFKHLLIFAAFVCLQHSLYGTEARAV